MEKGKCWISQTVTCQKCKKDFAVSQPSTMDIVCEHCGALLKVDNEV